MQALIPKRNKTGGIATSTVMGVGGLVIGVIIILVITSTLLNANLFTDRRVTETVNNETYTITDAGTDTFGNATWAGATCTLTYATNATGGETIPSTNYTVDNCIITAVTSSEYNGKSWNLTFSTTYYGQEEQGSSAVNTNLTVGINNISAKVPTILLIVAVVILFGALVLLLRNAGTMGIGGTAVGGSVASDSSL